MKPPFASDIPTGPRDGWGDGDSGDADANDSGGWRFRVGLQSRIGLILFLVSLGMLFAASLWAYLLIRFTTAVAPRGFVELPDLLWASTAILLLAGVMMHRSSRLAIAGADRPLRRTLLIVWILSAAFIAVQAPCLMSMARRHDALLQANVGLYGAILTLILIHALHVIGGMIPLSTLAYRAVVRPLTSAERHTITSCALYWHFLEGVWVLMFLTFWIAG